MLKVVLALCLIGSLVNAQVSFPTTATVNTVYTTGSGSSAVQVGSATQGTNGWLVGLSAPGWILSNSLGLTATTGSAVTVYTTLKQATGGFVAVGLTQNSGQGAQTGSACTAYGTTHSTAALANGYTAAAVCVADFITVYTASPTSTSVVPSTTLALTQNVPLKWVMTPTTTTPGTASTSCIPTTITPYTLGSATPTAGTVTTVLASNTCGSTAAAGFSLSTAATVSTFAFYVELGPSGTAAQVCFQTQAQFEAAPGVCSSSIITGVIASIGLLVALLFN